MIDLVALVFTMSVRPSLKYYAVLDPNATQGTPRVVSDNRVGTDGVAVTENVKINDDLKCWLGLEEHMVAKKE